MVHRPLIRSLAFAGLVLLFQPVVSWGAGSEVEEALATTPPCPAIDNYSAQASWGPDGLKSKLSWTVPAGQASDGLEGYFLYRFSPEDPSACLSPFNQNYFYKTYYSPTFQDSDGDGKVEQSYSEPLGADERLCYQVQPLCYSDAYRGAKSDEQCVCGDLNAFFSRHIDFDPWEGSSEHYVIDIVNAQYAADLVGIATPACTTRDIGHSDEASVPAGLHELWWKKSHWNATYYENPPYEQLLVAQAEIIEKTDDPYSPIGPKNIKKRYDLEAVASSFEYLWTGGHMNYEVTAYIPALKAECTSTRVVGTSLMRTPMAAVSPVTGNSGAARAAEYWGCSLCEPVTLESSATNYLNVQNTSDLLRYRWRAGRDNDPLQFSSGKTYSTEKPNDPGQSVPGIYRVNNRISVNHYDQERCHSDISEDQIITIYQSPANPQIEGPVSLCKDETNTTLTALNPDGIYHDFEWYECTAEYGECFIHQPLPCLRDYGSDNNPWMTAGAGPQYDLIAPAIGKQKQLYLRANALMAGANDRACYGQKYETFHFKECMSLPPYTHNSNEFFPATSLLEEPLPFNSGHKADGVPVLHSNLFSTAFALGAGLKVPVRPSIEYTASVFHYSGNHSGVGRIYARIQEYDIKDNLLEPYELTLNPYYCAVEGWCPVGGRFTTSAQAASLSLTIHLEYLSGFSAFDDIALQEEPSGPNLLGPFDPGFEKDDSWSYNSPDIRFPGSGFIRTDGAGISAPLEPKSGNYLFFHNLASGAFESDPISLTGIINGFRLQAFIRGETHISQGFLRLELDLLDSNGAVLESLSSRLPFHTQSWSLVVADLTPNVTSYDAVRVRLSAQFIDGWVAFDDVAVIPLDNNGNPKTPLNLINPSFASDCATAPCTLPGWHGVGDNPAFPATSVFHPAFYDEFQVSGPIASQNSDGTYAAAISNQMYGLTTMDVQAPAQELERAEYELGIWVRGHLHTQNLINYDAPVVLELKIRDVLNNIVQQTQYRDITPASLTAQWKQYRFTVVAPPQSTIRIRLLTPYLNGWVAFDEPTFGIWNRPPQAVALDTRYIPNQESDPVVFTDLEAFARIKADGSPTTDPDSGNWINTWELLPDLPLGDSRWTATLIDDPPDPVYPEQTALTGHLEVRDGQGVPAYLRLNQETQYQYKLRAEDQYNPALYTEDTGTITVEPFWALNAGFEAEQEDQYHDISPVYWQQADDDHFPGTGFPNSHSVYGSGLSGERSFNVNNLATGYITSIGYYPLDNALRIPPGNYSFSVQTKGFLRTGHAVLRVIFCRYQGFPLEMYPAEGWFEPSGSWETLDLPFTVPEADPADPDNTVRFIQFQIGVEEADGWVIFDNAALFDIDDPVGNNLLTLAYDPGFDQEQPLPFWNFADDSDAYPATQTLTYNYRLLNSSQHSLYPWIGLPAGGAGNYYGIIKCNQMRAVAIQTNPVNLKPAGQINSLTFKMKWNVLPFTADGIQYRGKVTLWVFQWKNAPRPGARASAAVPLIVDVKDYEFDLSSDTSPNNIWIQQYASFKRVGEATEFTFRLIFEMAQGWVAVDEFKANNVLMWNGSFEHGAQDWIFGTPGAWGTGIFIDEQAYFTPPSHQSRYLAVTNLAKGDILTPTQDIEPGLNYNLSLWVRGQDFFDDAHAAGRLSLQYYKNGLALGAPTLLDLPMNAADPGAFTLFQTDLQHPGVAPYDDTEQYQLKMSMEKLEGWVQIDDILLKPEAPMAIAPDPPIYSKNISCTNSILSTDMNKADYQWRFGNLTSDAMSTTYQQTAFSSGNYSVEYTEPGTLNHVLGFAKPFQLYDAPQIFIFDKLHCLAPDGPYVVVSLDQSHLFHARTVGGEPVINWIWNFGDGTTATGQQVYHAFTTPGIKTVTVLAYSEHCVGMATELYCVVSPAHPCQCNPWPGPWPPYEPLGGEELTTAYVEGDAYDQEEIGFLVVDKTVNGKVRKQDIQDLGKARKLQHELELLPFEDLLAEYEADGEPLTMSELKRALKAAAHKRDRDSR